MHLFNQKFEFMNEMHSFNELNYNCKGWSAEILGRAYFLYNPRVRICCTRLSTLGMAGLFWITFLFHAVYRSVAGKAEGGLLCFFSSSLGDLLSIPVYSDRAKGELWQNICRVLVTVDVFTSLQGQQSHILSAGEETERHGSMCPHVSSFELKRPESKATTCPKHRYIPRAEVTAWARGSTWANTGLNLCSSYHKDRKLSINEETSLESSATETPSQFSMSCTTARVGVLLGCAP